MNHYEETEEKIRKLILEKEYEKALRLIENELELSYVPRDFEETLEELLGDIKEETFKVNSLDEEEISSYLFMDESHQLLAVDALDKRNLRDQIPLCQKYLSESDFLNGKALLIDSLIGQQIDHEFVLKKNGNVYHFNPSKMLRTSDTELFAKTASLLDEHFMKEPSKLILAKQLLYKELMLSMPQLPDIEQSKEISQKIIDYINQAFEKNA